MAPIVFLVMIDRYLTQGAESVGRSVVHEMTVPPVGKTRVEGGKHRAAVLSRGVIGGDARVGQGAWITGGGKL